MNILITGSNGTIGTALKENLHYHSITGYDLPEHNVLDFEHLREAMKGQDAVIHLAWDFGADGFLGESLNPDNALMSYYVLQIAQEVGVKRVVMASSVHADRFTGHDPRPNKQKLLTPYALPTPDSPYGASKCMLEALGRYYADAKGLEVVCVRFGGVNRHDEPPAAPYSERQVWLSRRDCVNLIHACLAEDKIDGRYAIVYAVSDNKDRLHDLSNPFGWKPLDGAE